MCRVFTNCKTWEMRKFPMSDDKATVCTKGTCVTVFGPAAQLVTFVTVIAVVAAAASLIAKIAD